MVITSNKKNPLVKELFTKKYKLKNIKPKKGTGLLKEKKFRLIVLHQFVVLFLMTSLYLFQDTLL